MNTLQSAVAGGENIVVSVGLLPLEVGGDGKRRSVVGPVLRPGKIYGMCPRWIFSCLSRVRSPRTLEVTCLKERRREKGREEQEERRSIMGAGLVRKIGFW